jgi:hypothetical protein
MPIRRFFYHYRKCDGQMSVHFQGQCVPCKGNKRQPFLVMQGWATKIDKIGDKVLIS